MISGQNQDIDITGTLNTCMHHIEWKMGGWMIHLSEAKSKLLNDNISIFFLIGCSLRCSNTVAL